MKLLRQIPESIEYQLYGNKLYFTRRESGAWGKSLYSEEGLLVPDKVSMFFPLGDIILFSRWKEPYTYQLDLQTGTERVVRDGRIQSISDKYFSYRCSEKDLNCYVSRTSEEIYTTPYTLKVFLPDGGIAENETEVFRVDWDGNILWSFPFEALERIRYIAQVR